MGTDRIEKEIRRIHRQQDDVISLPLFRNKESSLKCTVKQFSVALKIIGLKCTFFIVSCLCYDEEFLEKHLIHAL
jgi:hypothetical protein